MNVTCLQYVGVSWFHHLGECGIILVHAFSIGDHKWWLCQTLSDSDPEYFQAAIRMIHQCTCAWRMISLVTNDGFLGNVTATPFCL